MKTNFVRLRLGCRVATVVVVLIGAAYPFSSVHGAADTGSITITPTGFILNKGQAALTPATKRIVKIDVGAPMKPGTDTLIIEPPGGTAGTVQVKLNGNETPAEKADKLATALTAKGIPFARAGTEFAFGVDKITAVDRTGLRLGRGGGSYDRALGRVPVGTFTCVVLQASEVRDEVPADAHDRRVTAVVTEDGVIRFRRSMSA